MRSFGGQLYQLYPSWQPLGVFLLIFQYSPSEIQAKRLRKLPITWAISRLASSTISSLSKQNKKNLS